MTSIDELLVLRLALIGVIFAFVLVTAGWMRAGLGGRRLVGSSPAMHSAGLSRLVVLAPANSGLAAGTEFALAGQMTIGRDPENSIVLNDVSVSGRHAKIGRTKGGWLLTDQGSTNGTLVNGRPCTRKAVRLRGNEQITFGAVVVRFQAF